MYLLNISIILFIILELFNVIILYFYPDSKRGNGVAIFKQYHKNKNDKNNYLFTKYLINWIAGTKIIFIALLIVILLNGTEQLKLHSLVALIISISTYYIKLYPIIKKLDINNEINPKGYSKNLTLMITGFIIIFIINIIMYIYA